MCGRYKIEPIKDGWGALATLLTAADIKALRNIEPRLDVRPTQLVPVVRWAKGEPAPKLVDMRWGFIPTWWKDDKPPQSTINARCEEAPVKPMWRQAVRNARCLIPCTGWYEWVPAVNKETGEVKMKSDGKTPAKLPVEMSAPSNPAICFAGLWSRATFGGKEIETCTIVTRAAIAPLDKLHDRMPVIVSPDDYRDWLNPEITDVKLFERVTQTEPPAKFTVLERGPGR
jgi:putative SOS response-associated peptidase YedK